MVMHLNEIIEDLKSSFPRDRKRLYKSSKNLDFYQGRFENHWKASEEAGEEQPRRTTVLSSYIVNTICQVNKEQPTRVVNDDPEATDFLGSVYSDNKMYNKMLQAERLSCVSQVSAFQVAGTDDPEHPIKIHLWDAGSFVVYTHPDDPTIPVAVVTFDRFGEDDSRKRYQVWTDKAYQVLEPTIIDGKADWLPSIPEVNQYGRIPFAFAHWQVPTLDFWPGSPGDNLTVANDYINRRLSKIGAAQEFLCEPIRVVKNGRDFNPGNVKPGEWLVIESAVDDNSQQSLDISIEDIQPDYSFNEAGWADCMGYIDLTLETHGVPLSATRMVQSTGRSGTSIMMEQWPLAVARKSRQPLWRDIEHQLAVVVFLVAGVHLRDQKEYAADAEHYLELSMGLDLTVTYPEVFMEVPGEERDRANDWELAAGLKSKVQVYQERQGVTREEALKHLVQVARDEAELAELVEPYRPERVEPQEDVPEDDQEQPNDTQEETQETEDGQGEDEAVS